MHIRATILAGLLGLPLVAGGAFAGQLSLADAARLGDRAAVRSLLAKADVAGPQSTAALIAAVDRNDLEMTDLLLAAGVDVNAANEFGATALYTAAANENEAMVGKLMAAGADVNAHLASGETPLMEAARRGNVDIVRALLAAKADPNPQEEHGGQSALMWAIAQRHPAVVEELVRGHADVEARSKRGFTPLMFAAQQGDAACVGILLGAGAKVNDVMPKTGLTPLIIASAMGHTEVVARLLDSGADANAVDARGLTPLHLAVRDADTRYGRDIRQAKDAVGIVTALLEHGANANVRLSQKQDKSADKKPRYGDREAGMVTVNGVVLQGATPLLLAAEINDFDAVKALVKGGADPLIPTQRNTTALILASGGGTDVLRPRSPEERATAIETVKFLVEHGADVNAAGQFGWTALHAAAYQGLNEVIEYLASKGADLDAKDEFGQTPLSISLSILVKDIGDRRLQIPRKYRRETADLLLKLGATPLERSGVAVLLQRTGDLTQTAGSQ